MAAQARAIKESAIRIEAVNLVTTCRHLELDAAHQVTKNLERLVGEMETEVRALESAVPKIVVLTNAAGCVSQPG
jgi:hypothetical protein